MEKESLWKATLWKATNDCACHSHSRETPQAKRARVESSTPKVKKHSPTFENATWDKENVLEDLRSLSSGTRINWSKFAREHNVPGKNNGQVVKSLLKETE